MLQELLHYYDKKTGRKSKKPPQFAKKGGVFVYVPVMTPAHESILTGQKIVAVIEASDAVCVEKFSEHPQMGRFTLRDEGECLLSRLLPLSLNSYICFIGKTVAIGKVSSPCDLSEWH